MGLQPRGGMSVTELLMNDHVSILVGTKYLAQQLQRFGQVDLALAAYNAGPEAVVRAGQRVPAFAETQAYVRRVLSLYAQHRRAGALSGVGA
jgi:soluble lytic murein transglycosylase-like protein